MVKTTYENRRRWLVAMMAAVLAMVLTPFGPAGCNTAEGFGEDLESAGEGLQDEAREEKYDDDDDEIDD